MACTERLKGPIKIHIFCLKENICIIFLTKGIGIKSEKGLALKGHFLPWSAHKSAAAAPQCALWDMRSVPSWPCTSSSCLGFGSLLSGCLLISLMTNWTIFVFVSAVQGCSLGAICNHTDNTLSVLLCIISTWSLWTVVSLGSWKSWLTTFPHLKEERVESDLYYFVSK